jgi:hypothetical protein
MKQVTLFLIAFSALVVWRCQKLDQPVEPDNKRFTAQELIQRHLKGDEISQGTIAATRERIMADLIRGSEGGGWDFTANYKGQDTSGIQAVFQINNMGTTNNGFRVRHRLKIFSGGYTPDIYSFCYIVRHSPGLTPLNSSILLEYQSNCIDFPPLGVNLHTSVLTHSTNQGFYFVFFDLNPFPLEWVDRIILEMRYLKAAGTTDHWITVDRSDPNNYALSPDGYLDYKTYFFPDTCKLN